MFGTELSVRSREEGVKTELRPHVVFARNVRFGKSGRNAVLDTIISEIKSPDVPRIYLKAAST